MFSDRNCFKNIKQNPDYNLLKGCYGIYII